MIGRPRRFGPKRPLPLPAANPTIIFNSSMNVLKTQTSGGLQVPSELWVSVLSWLDHVDLARALCTCRTLRGIGNEVWRAACYRRWPEWAAIAEEKDSEWQVVYMLLTLRSSEQAAVTQADSVRKRQTIVSERHRAILTEWLCEVSFDWDLESSVVYEAVRYLDNFLAENNVDKLGRFQLVGLACLRVAIADCLPPTEPATQALLDPKRFTYISADAYTTEQVEEATQAIAATVPPHFKDIANAKMHLRSVWFRSILRGEAAATEMYVYATASFLLQLGLLELPCVEFAPSVLAAAALSLAFSVFGKAAWPRSLYPFGCYTQEDLEPARRRLMHAQASQTAPQLRCIWNNLHKAEESSGGAHQAEWQRALAVFSRPSTDLTGPWKGATAGSAASSRKKVLQQKRQPQPQRAAGATPKAAWRDLQQAGIAVDSAGISTAAISDDDSNDSSATLTGSGLVAA